MKRVFMSTLVGSVLVLAGMPAASEEPVIGEVLQILKERGLIDDAKHNELVAKNQAYEQEHETLLGQIEWSGDFRARLENFWFDRDDTVSTRANRTRARYRLQIAGKAKINDWTQVNFRLASGTGDIRSTNQTLGSGNDFDPDGIAIDRAYLEFKAPKDWFGEDVGLEFMAGKTKNPFTWKSGKDYLLWDHDINPEGGALLFESKPFDGVRAYMTAGYYIIDENGTSRDPHFTGLQGGADFTVNEDLGLGLRGSWYNFTSVDSAFRGRSAGSGAVTDDGYSVIEVAGYVRYTGVEDWPILLYGHYARNTSAGTVSSFTGSDEDTGMGVGLEVGDKKQFAKLGFGYYVSEANFFPAQFTDSDLFDGLTNRKGFTIYASRQILPGTDLNFTLFKSDAVRSGLPVFTRSVRNSDRVRLQSDIVVKF